MSNPLTCLVTGYGSAVPADAAGYLTGRKPGPAAAAALRALRDDPGMRIILASRHSATRVLRAWFCLPGGVVVPGGSREPRS